jgi:type VI protein secretion system component Hcp
MSNEPKNDEQAPEVKTGPSGEPLPESELEKVAGGTGAGEGKVSLKPISVPILVDKASPTLF